MGSYPIDVNSNLTPARGRIATEWCERNRNTSQKNDNGYIMTRPWCSKRTLPLSSIGRITELDSVGWMFESFRGSRESWLTLSNDLLTNVTKERVSKEVWTISKGLAWIGWWFDFYECRVFNRKTRMRDVILFLIISLKKRIGRLRLAKPCTKTRVRICIKWCNEVAHRVIRNEVEFKSRLMP